MINPVKSFLTHGPQRPLKDKITASCLQHIIETKMNIEKLLGQQVFQNQT